ncbi:hypothetical protein [Paenibacillus spongiae]|uniref:Uncharacterized protein n=1 Tax=Paenibacillus spongiae TaxID=2909671 RepID=A0ABY5SJ73_9BACL|nr:hypothetical protein [Paenibacillus spongiae]UVI32757.1 hypothetical protein L1F29_13410 [Paenibacillus spongiae]
MNPEQSNASIRNFTLSSEIFMHANLDIYSQMTYIVLSSYMSESNRPSLAEIAQKGRMSTKQAMNSMQRLVFHKLIPHKFYRQMINEFQDDRLSWSAKGLLTYCKENTVTSIDELLVLCDQTDEDEQSIRKALDELKSAGYLEDYPELNRIVS